MKKNNNCGFIVLKTVQSIETDSILQSKKPCFGCIEVIKILSNIFFLKLFDEALILRFLIGHIAHLFECSAYK